MGCAKNQFKTQNLFAMGAIKYTDHDFKTFGLAQFSD